MAAPKLRYVPDEVPTSVIAVAKLSGIELRLVPYNASDGKAPTKLILPNSEELVGTKTLLRYFGRVSTLENFYGSNPLFASQADEWIDFAADLLDTESFIENCSFVDNYLSVRTFLAGYDLSIADVAIWIALRDSGDKWTALLESHKFPNLARWYRTTLGQFPVLSEPMKDQDKGQQNKSKSAKVSKESAAKKGEKTAEGPAEIELPEAVSGSVVTRFPPEPSGYMHIGHAKAAMMNQYFAKKYNGKLIIRFDDTNPSKEKEEFVDNILFDLETLGIKGDRLTFTSDYFDELQAMAVKMIKAGKAYVDNTPQETMREERMRGQESRCRGQTVEQNLALWEEMVKGKETGQACCVRGKLDMSSVNGTMRDPVYYRCNVGTSHHRTGTKYKVYPTYDFACPYVDSIEGVTHALRSSEYHDRNEQYDFIQADMGLRKVHLYDFSRLNFQYTLLSKRKLAWFVEQGRVEGWNDPRFPTVQGIIRRGLTVEALQTFILSQGASKNLNLMEWDKLWTVNKRIIDPVCARHTAVIEDRKVPLRLTNFEGGERVAIVPRHKKYPPAGSKATRYSERIWLDQADAQAIAEGEEVTLMDWGNAIVRRVVKGSEGVTELEGELHLEGSVKSTKLKLTWLVDSDELLKATLVDFDFLISKKKLEEEDDFTKVVNERTRWETAAIVDGNVRNVKKGEIIQLERKGYFICDLPFIRSSKPVVFLSIPDGRQKAAPDTTGHK